MDWDDLKPQPTPAVSLGEDLATHSIGELEARIKALESEIARVQAEHATKKARAAAAASLFKQ